MSATKKMPASNPLIATVPVSASVAVALLSVLVCAAAAADSGTPPHQIDTTLSAKQPAATPESGRSISVAPNTERGAVEQGQSTAVAYAPFNPDQIVTLSDADLFDYFGYSVALSADGQTMAVGVPLESRRRRQAVAGVSVADNAAGAAGAVVIYVRTAGRWVEQAWLKADVLDAGDMFGRSVSLSADGRLLAVGALGEDSVATHTDNSSSAQKKTDARTDENSSAQTIEKSGPHSNALTDSGAAYIFSRSEDGHWTQEAFLKANPAQTNGRFGHAVTLSSDGQVLVVMADDHRAHWSVYIFARTRKTWIQETLLTPEDLEDFKSNEYSGFGLAVTLSGDGSVLAVSAPYEGNAVYIYARERGQWPLSASLAAPAMDDGRIVGMGSSVSFNNAGDRLAVGAFERSWIRRAYGKPPEDCRPDCPDSYYPLPYIDPVAIVYTLTAGVWTVQAKIKFLKARSSSDNLFEHKIQMSHDGSVIVAGHPGDDVLDKELADGTDDKKAEIDGIVWYSVRNYGAVWTCSYKDGVWQEPKRFQAPAPEKGGWFGHAVAIDATGQTIAVAAPLQDVPLNGRASTLKNEDDIIDAGAVFVYTLTAEQD